MALTQRLKRKTLLILVILMMTVTMLPSMAFAASPSDISKHWAKSQIEDFIAKGLVNGYPDATFRPDNNITRAEFMVLVNKAFGYSEKASIDYKDVTASAWYADAVAKAKAAGYIAGYEDNTVKPNNPISRQEAAIVIMKAQKLGQNQTAPDKFTDASSIPAWSKGAIGAAVTAGIMTGYPDGTFKASNSIKRAEAVVALGKALANTTPVIPVEQSVIYDQTGTYGPATGTETVTGNVTIKIQDITLQNTVIEGNLIIDKAVGEGNATFKNVVVKGDTYVYGGGTNSVYFIDTQTGKTYVLKDSGPVRIVISGTSEVSQLIAQSSVKVEEVDLTGKGFEGIVADRKVDGTITVNLAGVNVDDIKVNSTNTIIVTDKNTHISSFVANAAVKVTGAGTISNVTINASGVTYDTKFTSQTVAAGVSAPVQTPSSGGGGSGGGSSVGLVSAINITGNAVVGATLTATPTPSGATGSYQWQRADTADGTYTNISGATAATYTLVADDTGKYIKVTLTGTGSYTGKVISVDAEGPIVLSNNASLTSVLGQTAATPTGAGVTMGEPILWSVSVVNSVMQVQLSDIVVPAGASRTMYFNPEFSLNKDIPIALTAGETKVVYIMVTAPDNTTARYYRVEIFRAAVPVEVSAINVTGDAVVGATLTAAPTPSGATGTYQWSIADTVDGTYTNIATATNITYTLVAGDVTKFVKVTFTASGSYTGTLTSVATGAIGKADGPALTGVTIDDAANTVSGITAVMEFSTDGTTWTVYNETTPNLPGLTGTVALQIRVAATATHTAGAATTFNFTVSLSSIAITTPATKTAYKVGEALDITGMVVTGTYSDSTTKPETVVAGDVSGFDSAAVAATQTLTVTVGGKAATYTISIEKADGPALTGVTIDDAANTVSGITAAMEFSTDGTTWTVYNETTPNLPGLTGTVALQIRVAATATHTAGAATTFNFTVSLSSIAITTPATKTAYKVGEALDITGMVVTGTYSDSSTKVETVVAGNVSGFSSAAVAATQTLTVTIGGKTATYVISIGKADGPTAPDAPTEASKTGTSVTLTANALNQFSKDAGSTWQDSEVFTGLTPLTAYTFVARVKETATTNASVASAGKAITTEAPAMTGTVAITGTAKFGSILTANPGGLTNSGTPTYQWNRGGAAIDGATASTYQLVEADITTVIKVTATAEAGVGTGSITSAGTAVVAKADGPTAPDAPTEASKTGTSVTLTANGLHQFSKDAGNTWQDSEVFTGLTPLTEYTFVARVKATATTNESSASTGTAITTSELVIGDSYGGGKIFYILQEGDTGYDASVQHGLIAATVDQGTNIPWALLANKSLWVLGTTFATIGSGSANTAKIIAQNGEGTYAAGLAGAYTNTDTGTGVYTDWYLPSKTELNKLYLNKALIGGIENKRYWSSTECDSSTACIQGFFATEFQVQRSKDTMYDVRAIRSFSINY